MEKTRVLNIDALAITEKELLEGLDRNLDGSDSGNDILITPNLDHLVKLQKDEEFYRCYQQAQWVWVPRSRKSSSVGIVSRCLVSRYGWHWVLPSTLRRATSVVLRRCSVALRWSGCSECTANRSVCLSVTFAMI